MPTEPTKQRPGDQPLPAKNDLPFIQDAVIADIEARKAVGIERYGTPLQAFNGRNADQDLYEELIDAAMYAKQRLVEHDEIGRLIRDLYSEVDCRIGHGASSGAHLEYVLLKLAQIRMLTE